MAFSAQAASFAPVADGPSYDGSSADAESAVSHRSSGRPVDLIHLARQSLGDRLLEVEILGMFRSQSGLYIERLANATTSEERKMAAHTILGSARGIGAWDVATEAGKIEVNASSTSDLGALRRALDEANEFITSVLDDI